MGLFGKTPERDPKELVINRCYLCSLKIILITFKVNDWTRKLRKEGYQLDRQIRGVFKVLLAIMKANFFVYSYSEGRRQG